MCVLTEEYIKPFDVTIEMGNEKTAVIEVNHNAIRKLLAISAKFVKNIDFEVPLAYPLTSVHLSLPNPDGS